MEEQLIKNLDEDKLKTCIDTLRDILNEMCSTLDDNGMSLEKLIVSRELDKLIVDYMILKKNKNSNEIEILTQTPFIL